MPEASDHETPITSPGQRAEEVLDETLDESFPASDPESSWSGLSGTEFERGSDESGDASA